jgi:hypothetical protein
MENSIMENLSDSQLLAITILVSGGTRGQAAVAADVAESTIYRWLTEDNFLQQLRETQARVFNDSVNELKAACAVAVNTLCHVANDSTVSASARVSAASAILSNCFKAVEQTEIQNRLEDLQRQLQLLEEK